MGRRPNTDARREQIVDALQTEMGAAGFSRATTKSIAERAGLAPGLVHYHFKDKEAILNALVERLIEQADARLQALLVEAASPADRLACYVAARVGQGGASDAAQVTVWVTLMADAMAIPAVRGRLRAWLSHDAKQLTAWFKAARISAPAAHAALLIASVLGSFSLHALSVDGVPKGYAAAQLKKWLDGVLLVAS